MKRGDKGYWQWRKNTGRPKKIKSPEELWNLACDYFQSVDERPWKKIDFKGKDAVRVEIPTQTPYTWSGFEDYLCERQVISTLNLYRINKDNAYTEFHRVITRIDEVIFTQKYEGAAVGAYNANIIARDLGLADRKNIDHTTKGEPITGIEIK